MRGEEKRRLVSLPFSFYGWNWSFFCQAGKTLLFIVRGFYLETHFCYAVCIKLKKVNRDFAVKTSKKPLTKKKRRAPGATTSPSASPSNPLTLRIPKNSLRRTNIIPQKLPNGQFSLNFAPPSPAFAKATADLATIISSFSKFFVHESNCCRCRSSRSNLCR